MVRIVITSPKPAEMNQDRDRNEGPMFTVRLDQPAGTRDKAADPDECEGQEWIAFCHHGARASTPSACAVGELWNKWARWRH